MPEAPGVNLLARIPEDCNLTPNGQILTLNGTDSIPTSLQEVGYPYTVSFKICPDTDSPMSTVLFKGPHSVFYANWENTRRFAFSRDGYTFVFQSYRLPEMNGQIFALKEIIKVPLFMLMVNWKNA